jgi:hypothetical protein
VRHRLGRAFLALRGSYGMIARQTFMCRGSCASAKIARDVEVMPAARRARVCGAVFYTRQAAEALAVGAQAARFIRYGFKGLHLSFGQIDLRDAATVGATAVVGLPTVEVGWLVAEALIDAGLAYEWDGTGDTTIKVTGLHDGLAVVATFCGPDAVLDHKTRK